MAKLVSVSPEVPETSFSIELGTKMCHCPDKTDVSECTCTGMHFVFSPSKDLQEFPSEASFFF